MKCSGEKEAIPDGWRRVRLGDVARERTQRPNSNSQEEVFSVTKHAGFVRSIEYFNRQVFSHDTSNYKLGCVDISAQPDESGGEMQKAQVSGVQFLKPGEYPAIVLYLVDEAFDQMALPVQMPVIAGGFLPV